MHAASDMVISNPSVRPSVCLPVTHLGVGRGPKNMGILGSDPGDADMADPRNMLLLTCVTIPNSVILGQNVVEIDQKILTPHAPPFKVTQGHWNRHGSIDYL